MDTELDHIVSENTMTSLDHAEDFIKTIFFTSLRISKSYVRIKRVRRRIVKVLSLILVVTVSRLILRDIM